MRSRKYLLTINNPTEHGFPHPAIISLMENFKYSYYCLCDEIGENGTYHTHLYFVCQNAVDFEKVKKFFPVAHIDKAFGTSSQNRDYIRKEGKYADSEKKSTNLSDTFFEVGVCPPDDKKTSVSDDVLKMIVDGSSNYEIIQKYPSFLTKINHIDNARQLFLYEKFKNVFRKLDVTFITGAAGVGKTSSVFENHSYEDVYKVTNYKNPFDGYSGQDIILFDEFNSQFPLSDFLQYLDGYPCRLPSRYCDKFACYTEVYIISNLPFSALYDYETDSRRAALHRRINRFITYYDDFFDIEENF